MVSNHWIKISEDKALQYTFSVYQRTYDKAYVVVCLDEKDYKAYYVSDWSYRIGNHLERRYFHGLYETLEEALGSIPA